MRILSSQTSSPAPTERAELGVSHRWGAVQYSVLVEPEKRGRCDGLT